jgi:hypothetical protein
MKKSIEERMEELKQEALIVNLKLQLEEERQKTDELKKRLSQTDGGSPLVVKEDVIGKRTGRLDLLPKCRVCDYVECAGIGGSDWYNQICKKETLIVKEEILIPPSNTTISYMEPSDYAKWGFFDFESTIPGLKFEDLQQL